MIRFKHKGNFVKTKRYFERVSKATRFDNLEKYGAEGVAALSSVTPVNTGLTARSWNYTITREKGKTIISYNNSNIQNGVQIAIILQYGHGTGTGGWVQGRDYINPAIQPVFDRIANDAWREVIKA